MKDIQKGNLFKEATDAERLNIIRTSDEYADFRADLDYAWEQACKKNILPLDYELFSIYCKNGSRTEYECEYFHRRLVLNSSFMKYILYREEKYLVMLENIIMIICGEYTWAVPAHIGSRSDCEEVSTYIDLFAAETGHALSEIAYILESELDERVKSRIKYEVNRRIINSYINRSFSFEKMRNNWAAVCAGCVGMSFIYLAPGKFPIIEERIRACMLHYLSNFGNDGVCNEGSGYWMYGFGYYIYFNELYREFCGRDLIEKDEKLVNIAEFFQKIHIAGDLVFSFSDSDIHEVIVCGLLYKLREIFGNSIILPDKEAYAKPVTGSNCYRFAHCVRNFLWSRLEVRTDNKPEECGSVFCRDAQWFINKNKHYAFALKGGHNDEPHNHNDLGSFIISDYKCQLISDVGKGEYSASYFAPETRYDNLCCSSLGHSVPIINGKAQREGKEYSADFIKTDENVVELDISGAYDREVNAVRRFEFFCDKIVLTDRVDAGECGYWTERLVSICKPELDGNDIRIGSMLVKCNEGIVPKIFVKSIYEHGFGKKRMNLYMIDYEQCPKCMTLEFWIEAEIV